MMDVMSTASPANSVQMVFRPAPFHSFRMMPHTLDAITLSDMSMLHEKAYSVLSCGMKLLPVSSPKNWLYHSTPARAQKRVLFRKTAGETLKYSRVVLFLMF